MAAIPLSGQRGYTKAVARFFLRRRIRAWTIETVYENGVLKPVQPLPLPEHAKVQITLKATVSRVRQTAGLPISPVPIRTSTASRGSPGGRSEWGPGRPRSWRAEWVVLWRMVGLKGRPGKVWSELMGKSRVSPGRETRRTDSL